MLVEKKITLRGLSPLLMHRYPMEPIAAIEKKTPAEQAEIAAYRMDGKDSELYVPSVAIYGSLVAGAAYVKGKGRGSLQRVAAACIMISPEQIGLGVKKYVIDSRPVVVPATRGRVLRHRPRLDKWQITFTLGYDDELMSEKQLREIVEAACSRVGALDYRPACKGPMGRSMIVEWE